MIGWLRRALGLGKRRAAPRPRPRPTRSAPRTPALTSEHVRTARGRVVLYMRRVRMPIRQAATVRQLWIADGGDKERRFHEALETLVVEEDGQFSLADQRPLPVGIVTWAPP